VAKLRGPHGLLLIQWATGGFALVESLVLALIILCGSWQAYADAAQKRQEAASAAAAPASVQPIVAPTPSAAVAAGGDDDEYAEAD
jgi:hypothetical protein